MKESDRKYLKDPPAKPAAPATDPIMTQIEKNLTVNPWWEKSWSNKKISPTKYDEGWERIFGKKEENE